ncbi:hypothetical protein [Limnobacter sp.]|uniref:hypothetical protein n=1 Tax=Limnobacter sp. TaxID=2003368 RepID=UPI00391C9052
MASKRTQRGYSVNDQIHEALKSMAETDNQSIAHELELAVLALIAQRIAQRKQVSLKMLNLYLYSSGVQVVASGQN